MSVGLFGAVTVRRQGVASPIGGDIPRAIVARLALDPGTVVAAEGLIRDVWGEAPPTIVTSLRSHVSRLRAKALSGVLEGGREGYRLAVPPSAVDVSRLEAAVHGAARGDAGALAELSALENAWMREPLADLRGFPFLTAARERLTRARRHAALALGLDRMQRGESAAAALGLAALAATHPDDTDLQSAFATALARSGRTSDALDALSTATRSHPNAELSELRARILRQDPATLGFAGADAAPIRRTGVPVPLTALVGRDPERQALTRARAAARLVTLVGPAGIGKTRLAIEHARQAAAGTDDEQWFADLTVLDDGAEVGPLLAGLLGANDGSIDGLARILSGRRALLVLDNAEHVLDSVREAVTGLLSRAAGLTILVTSREPLGLPGERLVRVGPLDGDRLDEAVALFVQRARDVLPDFAVTPDTAAIVNDVCRAVDGIPLALTLAASRLDVMPLAALPGSLHQGTEVAVGVGRHATLDAAIEGSARLLSADEAELMRQLALFVGPFTLAAVNGICVTAAGDPVTLTTDLVRKSLVAVTGDEGGERRYRLLDAVRAHFRRDLADGETAGWRARHAEWMAGLALERGSRLVTADAKSALIALDHSRPDLRLALDTAVAAGSRSLALMIFAGQATYWFRRALFSEGLSAAGRAFDVPGHAPPALEGRALLGRTMLAYQSGDAPSAFQYIRRAAELGRASGDAELEAVALANDAYGIALLGDPRGAEQLMERALALSTESPAWIRAEVGMCHGQMLRGIGRPAQALRVLGAARALAAEAGYRWAESSVTYVTGKILIDVGRGADAIAVLRPGVAGALAGDDPTSALALLHAIGGATALIGAAETGATLFGMVDAVGRRYEYNPVAAEGADASILRDRVRDALDPADFDRAHTAGASLGFAEAWELVDSLA